MMRIFTWPRWLRSNASQAAPAHVALAANSNDPDIASPLQQAKSLHEQYSLVGADVEEVSTDSIELGIFVVVPLKTIDIYRENARFSSCIPILYVKKIGPEKFELVSGHLTLMALRASGVTTVEVTFTNGIPDGIARYLAHGFRDDREDVFVEADSIMELTKWLNVTDGRAAENIDRTRSYVVQQRSIARLPAQIRDEIRKTKLAICRSALAELSQAGDEASVMAVWVKLKMGGIYTLRAVRNARQTLKGEHRRALGF